MMHRAVTFITMAIAYFISSFALSDYILFPSAASVAEEAASRLEPNTQPASVIAPDLDPCRYFTAREPMVSFFIEMDLENKLVPIRVPKRFLQNRSDDQVGVVHSTQLFPVTIPEFEPISPQEEGRRNTAGESWDWMHFTIGDILPLEETAGLQLRRNDLPFGDPRRVEEIEIPPRTADFSHEPGPYGLSKVAVGPNRGNGEDLFVTYDTNDKLSAWLLCRVEGVNNTLNERCRHHYRTSGVDVTLSYRRTELPNWHKIQDNVTRFLICASSFSE